MKGTEHQMSSQLQKKGTTSAQECKALDKVTTIMATKNKENEVKAPSVNKRKKTGERLVLITPNKKRRKGMQKAASKQKAVKSGPAISMVGCKYGCRHGGLLEFVQMIPKYTKYHSEEVNYFHDKQCKDCEEPIGDLFGIKGKRDIFYYCHMDNKVAKMSFDDQEKETPACTCILCLPCYYKRDEKKKMASEKSTRSSGRGHG
jgi:hypothetical protein